MDCLLKIYICDNLNWMDETNFLTQRASVKSWSEMLKVHHIHVYMRVGKLWSVHVKFWKWPFFSQCERILIITKLWVDTSVFTFWQSPRKQGVGELAFVNEIQGLYNVLECFNKLKPAPVRHQLIWVKSSKCNVCTKISMKWWWRAQIFDHESEH